MRLRWEQNRGGPTSYYLAPLTISVKD